MKKVAAIVGLAALTGCALCTERGEGPSLGDHNWLVSQVGSNPVVEGSELSLSFSDDGRVSGKAGCNGFSGSYQLDKDTLTIGQLARTKRMCMPASLMQQEQAFLDLLASVSSYRIEDGRLQLRAEEGPSIQALVQQP